MKKIKQPFFSMSTHEGAIKGEVCCFLKGVA